MIILYFGQLTKSSEQRELEIFSLIRQALIPFFKYDDLIVVNLEDKVLPWFSAVVDGVQLVPYQFPIADFNTKLRIIYLIVFTTISEFHYIHHKE